MSNSVELIGWYGGDEAIACSAWTSTSRNQTEEKSISGYPRAIPVVDEYREAYRKKKEIEDARLLSTTRSSLYGSPGQVM